MNTVARSVWLLPAMILVLALQAQAQDRVVTGRVTAQDTGEPLPGVNVVVKGTSIGTATDLDGRYSLKVPEGATLVFSAIGFKTEEVVLGDRSVLDVALTVSISNLDEVVVIGYGEQSRATLTTSISKLDTLALQYIPYANPASALQGTIPGLRVQTTTGQPGAAPRVILRGGTSINNPNAAEPLYIVDGVIRNNINDLNALDFESVQVLKDAAATAIYGSRASNGVVIITTKSAKPGRTQINYSSSLQISELGKRMPLASARDYIYFGRLGVAATAERRPDVLFRLGLPVGFGTGNDLSNRTAFTTQYLTPENEHKLKEGWESMPDPLDSTKTIIFKETDWQDVLFDPALTQNHYLSISGGRPDAAYNLSFGYLDNEGITIRTGYRRMTVDMGGRVQVRDNLSFDGQFNYSNASDNRVFSEFQIFQRALGLPPTAKLTYEDGSLAPGQNRSIGNPLYHLSRIKAKNSVDRMTLGLHGLWEIRPGLTFEPSASLYSVRATDNSFQMSYWNTPTQFVDSRDASAFNSIYWQRQIDGVLTYDASIGRDHNLQAKLGASYYDRKLYQASASGRGASTDLVPTLNASSEPVSVWSSSTDQVILGYFSRVTYDYKQKYLLSASARYDGASNLGTNNRWGFFPGISAGWNLHRERFWNTLPAFMSSLKLRASYGVNGNISGLSDFHAQGLYSVGARYSGAAAIQNNRMANQNLRWEKSKTVDVGFDLGLMNDRITLLVDYYRRVTSDLLTSLELPQSTGFSSLLTNLGSLENRGFELEFNARIFDNPNGLNWRASFNAATNQNRILRLPDNGNENNRIGGIEVYDPKQGKYVWVGGLQEGKPIGDLYIWKHLGVYATDEEVANAPLDMLISGPDKTKKAGDAILADLDGNGIIDTRDQVYVGNIFPDWTGGIINTFSYKNLTLTVRMDFALGHTIFNQTLVAYNGQTQGDIGFTDEVLRSWQKPGDRTNIPRYYWADQLAQNNIFRGNRGTSYYYEKGDYLALREVTASYTLPQKWVQRLSLASARVYLTGSNLHYFTAYKGLLPEDGGTDNGRYPLPRSITMGVNIGF
ncbi:MAG: SusC/RagA family TonB-linked outer membrane protein [Rhodothermaceae bacterium]|nr:MAG: SusC/RagA family TonB-linked outer membrane protein [Rhodothermaceae bacterium]